MHPFLTRFVLILSCLGLFGCSRACQKETSSPSLESSQELVVGTNSAYPPYESMALDGTLEGFDIDIANEIGKRLHKKVIFKDLSFDALILSLKQKKIDIILSGMSMTHARQKEIDMIPYQGMEIRSYAAVLPENGPFDPKSLEDLKTLTKPVATQIGTHMEDFLRKHYPNLEIKAFEATSEIILDVVHGKSAVAILEPHIAKLASTQAKGIRYVELLLPKEDQVLGNGIGIRKEDEALKKTIQSVIQDMKQDGTITKLETKWFQKKE